jgi:hypothetical protein
MLTLASCCQLRDGQALEMVTHTRRRGGIAGRDRAGAALRWSRLTGLGCKHGDGGIYDQLGGGFHRYSTDDLASGCVPHFEKMLYDNAASQDPGLYAQASHHMSRNRSPLTGHRSPPTASTAPGRRPR